MPTVSGRPRGSATSCDVSLDATHGPNYDSDNRAGTPQHPGKKRCPGRGAHRAASDHQDRFSSQNKEKPRHSRSQRAAIERKRYPARRELVVGDPCGAGPSGSSSLGGPSILGGSFRSRPARGGAPRGRCLLWPAARFKRRVRAWTRAPRGFGMPWLGRKTPHCSVGAFNLSAIAFVGVISPRVAPRIAKP